MLSLFYPLESKLPDIVENELDIEIRSRLGLALGQVKRFNEALSELSVCAKADPENFSYHSAWAYTACHSLYAAQKREIHLPGDLKHEWIDTAHRHFEKARAIRPDDVTCHYREGMMFKELEHRPDQAVPLLRIAIGNWEALNDAQREERHHEKRKYIKSLFQLSDILLKVGDACESLQLLNTCIEKDKQHNHLSSLSKYFALGKVLFHLNQLQIARDALIQAIRYTNESDGNFVYELLARTHLHLNDLGWAWEVIQRVPLEARPPYYRCTEADILCAMKEYNRAYAVLTQSLQTDDQTRHKALIRMARIDYRNGNYQKASEHADEAVDFVLDTWGKSFDDGLFWKSVCQLQLGNFETARASASRCCFPCWNITTMWPWPTGSTTFSGS